MNRLSWGKMLGLVRFLCRLATLWLAIPAGIALAGPFELTILHTNDIHAHLAAFDKYGVQCSPEKNAAGERQGGAARLAAAVAAERGANANVILLDAGDQFQGTLFFTHYKGQACARVMNLLAYDAMTLGNHEFDDGVATLAAFLKVLHFPALAANLDASASPALAGLVRPWSVLDVHGRKVGIVGIANPDTPNISNPGPALTFQDPAAPVARAVAQLRSAGVGIIIGLSHLGLEGDRRLAAKVAGLDVIVGGHSHVLLANDDAEAVGPCPLVERGPDGQATLIVTAGQWGRHLGKLKVIFDEQGRITGQSGNPLRMDASAPEDAAVAAVVGQLAGELVALQGEVVGETTTALESSFCRTEECPIGDLRADAVLAATVDQHVAAVLINGGSVRSGMAAGPITMGDVRTAFPFDDALMTVTLSGADLRAVLEHGLSALGRHEGSGRFLQVAGLRYIFDSSRPEGSRLLDVKLVGADGALTPLDPQADYRIALPSFLYRGGDGYLRFTEQGRDVFTDDRDMAVITAEYIRAHSPLQLRLDGRIRDLAQEPQP